VRWRKGEFHTTNLKGSKRRREHAVAVAMSATDKILSMTNGKFIAAYSSGPFSDIQMLGIGDDSVRTNQGNAAIPAIPPRT